MRLKQKFVLITGAAQGIGKACAELFTKEGATVYLSDINDTLGQKVAQGLKQHYLHLDVSSEADWMHVLHQMKHLDILINNAGITGLDLGSQDPEHASLSSWKQIHAVNAEGVFLGCKMAIAAMKERGGSIVNISSRSGLVGIPGAVAYASSKASVRNHTKSVALYCCNQNYPIRCNSIHPAAILTPMWEPMLGHDPETALRAIAKDIPMKRLGTPEEVAYAALFLASDESSYITGTELTIDGGLLAGAAAAPIRQES